MARNDAASARLVVEAVVEKLDVKRSLFKQLEDVLGGDAVALHEKLKEMLSSSAGEDQMQAAAAFARYQPSMQ